MVKLCANCGMPYGILLSTCPRCNIQPCPRCNTRPSTGGVFAHQCDGTVDTSVWWVLKPIIFSEGDMHAAIAWSNLARLRRFFATKE